MHGAIDEFDATSPCLVLAPHLEYPLRRGADILIGRKYAHFSKYVPFVDIVGKDTITRYRNGKAVESTTYANRYISKNRAGVNTLVKRSHFWLEQVVTKPFQEIAKLHYSKPEYGMVLFSGIWTASILDTTPRIQGRLHCVETHNDELKWFKNLRSSSTNPLAKAVAYFSERWARDFLRKHERDFLFFHVSKADQEGYRENFPDHTSYVVPIGEEEVPDKAFEEVADMVPFETVRLIFVGSLGVTINVHAVKVLEGEFFPLLKGGLNEELEVLIVGSNPSKEVIKACRHRGWKLHRDVSDEELERLYRISTFSVLPFHYTTGSKLKLLNSLAHGTPYLATSVLHDQTQEVPYPCLISDDPNAWLHRILEIKKRGISREERIALLSYTKSQSWPVVARYVFDLLSSPQDVKPVTEFPIQ